MEDQTKLPVESDAAELDGTSSPGDGRKLDRLVNRRLRGVASSERSLEEVVQEMSRNAQSRGLTEEILGAFLRSK